jgi:Predicted solute binding protein
MHSLCANPRSVLIGSLVFFLVAAIPLGRAIAESDLLDGSVEQKQTIKALHHKFRRRAALHRVNLAWEPSPSPNIDGYRVYYGTSSGSYTDHIDVGMAMTARLPKPPNGTYFYIVVAYKGSVESSPSNEVDSDKAVPAVTDNDPDAPTIVLTPAPSPDSTPFQHAATPRGPSATAPESNQSLSAANAPAVAATPTLRFQRRLERLHMGPRESKATGAGSSDAAPK